MLKSTIRYTIVTLLFITIGCTKKRGAINSQTSGIEHLETIAGLNNKECTITTQGGENTARKIRVTESDTDVFGSGVEFPLVRNITKTDCPMLTESARATLDFKSILDDSAPEGVNHRIKYVVERDNLVIYKIVNNDQMAKSEKMSAIEVVKDKLWKVPVGGFAISGFYNVAFAKNGDNRDTNQRIPIPVPKEAAFNSKGELTAQFMQLDKGSLKSYESKPLIDVVEKTYFTEGEWYYSETSISKSQFLGNTVGGHDGHAHNGDESVSTSVVKFAAVDDVLYALSTVVDEGAKKENQLNMPVVLAIDVDHVDYRRSQQGDQSSLGEEEVTGSRKDKKYFKLKYKSLRSTLQVVNGIYDKLKKIFKSIDPRKRVVSINYEEDYFSVTIESATDGLMRYSFKRRNLKERDYEPKRAYVTDMARFGMFQTKKVKVYDETTNTYSDLSKFLNVSRFNPNKNIEYRFSKSTSREKWVREVGREAINIWNQAFQKAGLSITVTLDDDCSADEYEDKIACKDVDLGDIRYNVLNMIDNKYLNIGPTGFGPVLSDPETGETIAATANVYLSEFRPYNSIRDYMKMKAGFKLDFSDRLVQDTSYSVDKLMLGLMDNNLFAVTPVLETRIGKDFRTGEILSKKPTLWSPYRWTDDSQTDITEEAFETEHGDYTLNNFFDLGQKITLPPTDTFIKQNNNSLGQSGVSSISSLAPMSQSGINISKHIVEFIEHPNNQACLATKEYVENLTGIASRKSTEEENKIFASCAIELQKVTNLPFATHEIGHNFSLRHNFQGSYDQKNHIALSEYDFKYIDIKKYNFPDSFSSVMDYPYFSYFQPNFMVPGWYDIAALRFVYSDKLELAMPGSNGLIGKGSYIPIPLGQSIDDVDVSGTFFKRYNYCTDIDARATRNNVFCALSDNGFSATEIVQHHADRVLSHLEMNSLRLDKGSTSSQLGIMHNLAKMKLFYDEWRNLVSTRTGVAAKYLQGYDKESYNELVNDMLADKDYGAKYKDFLQARNIYVNLLMDLAFLPNKYCRVKSAEGSVSQIIELSHIREVLSIHGSYAKVSSCTDEPVTDYLAKHELELIEGDNEIGYFLKGGKFSLDKHYQQSIYMKGARHRDFSGTLTLRAQSVVMISSRMTQAKSNREKEFYPNMLDEPDIRDLVTKILMNRVLEGVQLKENELNPAQYVNHARLLNEDDEFNRIGVVSPDESSQGELSTEVYQNYQEEKNLVELFYKSFFRGLIVPNDPDESTIRRSGFSVSVSDDRILNRPNYKWYKNDKMYLYTELGEDNYASQIIDRIFLINKEINKEADEALDDEKSEKIKLKLAKFLTKEIIADTSEAFVKALKPILDLEIRNDKGEHNLITFAEIYYPYKALVKAMTNEVNKYPNNPEYKLLIAEVVRYYEKSVMNQVFHFASSKREDKIPNALIEQLIPFSLNLPENYNELTSFFPEGEETAESKEVTKYYKEFLNTEISVESVKKALDEISDLELAKDYTTKISNQMKEDSLQKYYVSEFKDEKRAQKSMLINLLLMSSYLR